jgi:hypothetical protein
MGEGCGRPRGLSSYSPRQTATQRRGQEFAGIDQGRFDLVGLQHQGHFRAAGDDGLGARGLQGFGQDADAGANVLAQIAALDAIEQAHELGLVLVAQQDLAHGLFGQALAIEGDRAGGAEHAGGAGALGFRLGGGAGDHIDDRQAGAFGDQVDVAMGGVAGDGQNLGPCARQALGHFDQHRAGNGGRVVAVRHLGIDVHQHAQMVLVTRSRRVGLQAGQEVQRRRRTHAAQYPQDLARHDQRWPSSTLW